MAKAESLTNYCSHPSFTQVRRASVKSFGSSVISSHLQLGHLDTWTLGRSLGRLSMYRSIHLAYLYVSVCIYIWYIYIYMKNPCVHIISDMYTRNTSNIHENIKSQSPLFVLGSGTPPPARSCSNVEVAVPHPPMG
jgi:hypothetical protein